MSKTVTYLCPKCNGQILHEIPDEGKPESEYEICGMCGTRSFIKDLENKPAYGASAFSGKAAEADAMVTYIDTAESALAYMENFFENYDWEEFMSTSALGIASVEKMVDKILIKSAANPATWELQFTSVATPVLKKIAGLKKLEDKFFAEYIKSDDLSECFGYFDTYRRIVNNIVASRGDILKKLELVLKYYKKYNGSEDVEQQLTAQFAAVSTKLKGVKPVKEFKELPGFQKACNAKQTEISNRLAEKSVNAEEVYNEAVAAYDLGGDLRPALEKFLLIAGYKDADDYARKINSWLKFNISDGIFIKLGKKHYKISRMDNPVLSMNNLQQTARQPVAEDGVTRFEMYEIIDKKQSATPCIGGITQILCFFGGVLYYIKNANTLCSFNSEAEADAETAILAYDPQEIDLNLNKKTNGAKGGLYIANNKLFMLQKLGAVVRVEEKKGCFKRKKNKAPATEVVTKNNFSLIAVNLVTGALETVIPELVDIHCIFGAEIFFDKINVIDGLDDDRFFAYNYETNETREVLNAETEIVDVVDGKAVYFLWAPNDYNKDLYVYDFATGESKLIETNVYDYYGQIEGMLYYYVGNESNKTLYRINADGSEKHEIKNNRSYFNRALTVRNGWLYFKTGSNLNTALVKMSTDGSKYIPLCRQIKTLVKISDGYVYYVDCNNNLCMVREDGSEYKKIIDSVENFIEVTDGAIYLLRRETVDETETAYIKSNSLYRVDLDGAGLKKVAFDVSNAKLNPSDSEEIYLYKTNKITYSVAIPVSKDSYETTYETRTIKHILIYNTKDESFTEVASFGEPDDLMKSYTFKSGCFKKRITKDAVIKEIPNKKTFKRGGLISAGTTANEQLQSLQAQQQKQQQTPPKA